MIVVKFKLLIFDEKVFASVLFLKILYNFVQSIHFLLVFELETFQLFLSLQVFALQKFIL